MSIELTALKISSKAESDDQDLKHWQRDLDRRGDKAVHGCARVQCPGAPRLLRDLLQDRDRLKVLFYALFRCLDRLWDISPSLLTHPRPAPRPRGSLASCRRRPDRRGRVGLRSGYGDSLQSSPALDEFLQTGPWPDWASACLRWCRLCQPVPCRDHELFLNSSLLNLGIIGENTKKHEFKI